MTTNVPPRPIGEATELVFRIRRLVDEHAMDRGTAAFHLSLLYEQSDNENFRRLCARIAEGIQAPAPPMPEPIVEVFAP